MALNRNEGVFLILHLGFSVGVGLCERVMGPQALPAACCQQLCPSRKTDHIQLQFLRVSSSWESIGSFELSNNESS